MAVVVVGVMRLDSRSALWMMPGAWSVSCAYWRSFVLILGDPCLALFVPGVANFLRVTPPPCKETEA